MQLATEIKKYYFDHFEEMSSYYRLHFASRLYYWNQDSQAKAKLDTLFTELYFDGDTSMLRSALEKKLQPAPQPTHMNGAELREKYFLKYPKLRPVNAALFQLMHWQHLFDVDLWDHFWQIVDKKELLALRSQLFADPQAFAILSTYAVNFVYLLTRCALQEEDGIDINWLYDLKNQYDLGSKTGMQLYIYLYTHCIIAESLFYFRHIPPAKLDLYQKMLKDLETVIAANFDAINLDNKFEFLVCASICDYQSSLKEQVHAEAARSLSDTGIFVVDRHNSHQQQGKSDLTGSEHRNVLFIMSALPFRPTEQLGDKAAQ